MSKVSAAAAAMAMAPPPPRIGERKPSPAEYDAAMLLFQLPRAGSASPPATNSRGSATSSESASPVLPPPASSSSSSSGRHQMLHRNTPPGGRSGSMRASPRSYNGVRSSSSSGSRSSGASLARSLSPPAIPRNGFHGTVASSHSRPHHLAHPFADQTQHNGDSSVKQEVNAPPSPGLVASAQALASVKSLNTSSSSNSSMSIDRDSQYRASPLSVPTLSLPTSANSVSLGQSGVRSVARSASDADVRLINAAYSFDRAAHASRSTTSSSSSSAAPMKYETVFNASVISPPPIPAADSGGVMPMADSPTGCSAFNPPMFQVSVSPAESPNPPPGSVSAPTSTNGDVKPPPGMSTYLLAAEMHRKNFSAIPWNSSKKRNSACHFCDHAAQRPGRNKVALQVACCMRDCRKVFCSRPSCFKKLPRELGVTTYKDFVDFRQRVEKGQEIFVCPHCADESTCNGPQCYRRWEKRRKNFTAAQQANADSSSSGSGGGFMNSGLKSLRTLGGRFKSSSKARSGSMVLPPSGAAAAAERKRKGSAKNARDVVMNLFSRGGSGGGGGGGEQATSGDSSAVAGGGNSRRFSSVGGGLSGAGSGGGNHSKLKRQRSRRMSAAMPTFGGSMSSAEALGQHQHASTASSSGSGGIESISAGAATPPAPFNRSGSGNTRLAKRRCTDVDVAASIPTNMMPPPTSSMSSFTRHHLHPFGGSDEQPSLSSMRKSVSLPTQSRHPLADSYPTATHEASQGGRAFDGHLQAPITRQSRSLPADFSHPNQSSSSSVKAEPASRNDRTSWASSSRGGGSSAPPPLERPASTAARTTTNAAADTAAAAAAAQSSSPPSTPAPQAEQQPPPAVAMPQPMFVPMNMMPFAFPVAGAGGGPAGYIAMVPTTAAAGGAAGTQWSFAQPAAAATGAADSAAVNPFAAFLAAQQTAAAAAPVANSNDSSATAVPAPAQNFPMFVPVVQTPHPNALGAAASGASAPAQAANAFPSLFPMINMQQLMQMQMQMQQAAATTAATAKVPQQAAASGRSHSPSRDGDIDMQDLSEALPSTGAAPPRS